MKLFECIIDTGESTIKRHFTANNKRELITGNSWLGEFVKVTDITNDLFKDMTMEEISVNIGSCEGFNNLQMSFIIDLIAKELYE